MEREEKYQRIPRQNIYINLIINQIISKIAKFYMLSVYSYIDYKEFLNDWIQSLPREGRGQHRKIAEITEVHPVVISQILRSDRNFNLAQAFKLARYLGFDEKEREYFLFSVELARAESKDLELFFLHQMQKIKKDRSSLKNRIPHTPFSDEAKAEYYSHWYYSAIRIAASIETLNSAVKISEFLELELDLVRKVIAFLIRHSLLKETDQGLVVGSAPTHLGHDSIHVNRHHSNWRLKALQKMNEKRNDKNFFYTGPMSLSESDAAMIRELLMNSVESVTKKVISSPPEKFYCLDIDWFSLSD